MDLDAKRAFIRRVRANLKVGEVFCTKIVKGARGESVLVGMTTDVGSLSPEDAEIAVLLLGAQVDQLALDRAAAGSVISERDHGFQSQKVRANYNMLLDEALAKADKAKRKGLHLETGTDG